MNYIDIINSLFEIMGVVFATLNIIQLVKDKQVKGINILSAIFFTIWGIWTIYFYFKTENIYSMYAGMIVVLSEIIWVVLWFYYSYQEKRKNLN